MGTKIFPPDFLNRGTVKVTDKLMITNIDTGATEYTTVAELFATIAPLANPSFTGIVNNLNVIISGVTATSLGINVNTGGGGRTYLLLASRHTDTGDATSSAMYLVRCGYDGDHYSCTFIGGTDFLTFSLVSSILYAANVGGGVCRIGIYAN